MLGLDSGDSNTETERDRTVMSLPARPPLAGGGGLSAHLCDPRPAGARWDLRLLGLINVMRRWARNSVKIKRMARPTALLLNRK